MGVVDNSAHRIVLALKGRWFGSYGLVRCPAHDDLNPSLSIALGAHEGVVVKCHAGCSQPSVIAALRDAGLWNGGSQQVLTTPIAAYSTAPTEKKRLALEMWRSALPAAGTLIERYLLSRGLALPKYPSLRFHARLKHPAGRFWPTMVALVTNAADGKPQAIHRTYLAADGAGKAPVSPQRAMLGPCRGGAVRLAEPDKTLMIGEGIETCLAAMQATGKPAWAALSTSSLRALDLPNHVRDVIVLADGDDAGEAAACDCAWRWKQEGRRVRIARPPHGMDFNDMLVSRVLPIEEGAQ